MIPILAAIAAVTIVEMYALHKGINGKILAASFVVLGALGGVAVKSLVG